jgi:hypothetical protein
MRNYYDLGSDDAWAKYAGDPTGHYRSYFTGELRKDATFFPPGAMANASAQQLYQYGTNEKISPDGPLSASRWISYYVNRAGKNLDPKRKEVLNQAKKMLLEEHAKRKAKEKT